MPSLTARFVESVALPVAGGGREWSAEAVRARPAAEATHPTVARPPRWLPRAVRHSVTDHAGWPVHELSPKPLVARAAVGDPAAEVTVLYLHGGGYISEALPWHWYLMARLARLVPARLVVPMYPLVPRGAAARVVPLVADLLTRLVTRARAGATPAGRVVLMGDSAGGGLALAAAPVARARGAAPPARIALIAPWAAVARPPPPPPALDRLDRLLTVEGLVEAGRRWAGALDPADPLASPLNGTLAGLAPLTVLCGTHDLLLPDSRRLAERAAASGVEIDYHEAPGLPHAYPLFPIPEARRARATLAAAVRAPI
ncbi:alpha/beta hydrolase fold domain-containing protein [Frankia sp. CNm7]|uniref:alpha/beta fold hydrolase n=1 Tax=Frankia nepalensis TaxID=1836974 RepID=UPI001931E7E3|nr:alpha/beta hydrolase [Frankia nepalensis]MBL7518670.1 alpha/beta hydrolase fold domain-containing protein [Frankia nepalensis]